MHGPILTIAQTFVALLGVLLVAALGPSAWGADKTVDVKAKIEKLGGSVRPLDGESGALEVEFHLRGKQLTDDGLAHVAVLDNVASLNLRDTQITGAGLVHLKGLTSLRFLHLERTAVGDEGIEHLAGLTNLEYLNLYSTNITDKSLEHLTGLKKLTSLYVWQTGVTDEGVARLERALPDLKIVRGVDLSKLPDSFPSPEEKPKPKLSLKWVAISSRQDAPQRSENGINTQVFFENKSERRVKIYWITYAGDLKLYGELEPGGTRQQNTYARNAWLITDESEIPLGYFVVEEDEALAVIPGEEVPE